MRLAITHGKPLAAPGAKFHYSDTGYILLGEMLERESGGSLAAAYRTLLGFERLGLRQTSLETPQPTPAPLRARAHQIWARSTPRISIRPSTSTAAGASFPRSRTSPASITHSLRGTSSSTRQRWKTMLWETHASRPDRARRWRMFAESVGRQTCWHHDGFWGTSVLECPSRNVTIAVTVNQANDFDLAVQQLEAVVLSVVRGKWRALAPDDAWTAAPTFVEGARSSGVGWRGSASGRYVLIPTETRYSCSKRACVGGAEVPLVAERSSASSNSASRPLLRAFAWATIVGP